MNLFEEQKRRYTHSVEEMSQLVKRNQQLYKNTGWFFHPYMMMVEVDHAFEYYKEGKEDNLNSFFISKYLNTRETVSFILGFTQYYSLSSEYSKQITRAYMYAISMDYHASIVNYIIVFEKMLKKYHAENLDVPESSVFGKKELKKFFTIVLQKSVLKHDKNLKEMPLGKTTIPFDENELIILNDLYKKRISYWLCICRPFFNHLFANEPYEGSRQVNRNEIFHGTDNGSEINIASCARLHNAILIITYALGIVSENSGELSNAETKEVLEKTFYLSSIHLMEKEILKLKNQLLKETTQEIDILNPFQSTSDVLTAPLSRLDFANWSEKIEQIWRDKNSPSS